MFVKQIEMREALRLAGEGKDIMLLAPKVPRPEKWEDYYPVTLQEFLEGCTYFRQELAMKNPEFETAVQDMASEDAAETAADSDKFHQSRSEEPEAPAEPSGGDHEKTSGNVGAGAKRKKIDVGKLKALRNAGWSMKNIAVEFGVAESTIYNYLKKLEEDETVKRIAESGKGDKE